MKKNIIHFISYFIIWIIFTYLCYNITFYTMEHHKLSTMKQAFIWMNHEKNIMPESKDIYYYCIKQLKNEVGYSGINKWCIFKITDKDVTNIVRQQIQGIE